MTINSYSIGYIFAILLVLKAGVSGTLVKKKNIYIYIYRFLVQKIIPRLELLFMHKTTLIFSSFSTSKKLLCLLHDFGSVSHSLTFSPS